MRLAHRSGKKDCTCHRSGKKDEQGLDPFGLECSIRSGFESPFPWGIRTLNDDVRLLRNLNLCARSVRCRCLVANGWMD